MSDDVNVLEEAMVRIYELAGQFGLDPYPIHWEVVPASIMYEFGAYGLPGRFSHWTHGKAFASMKTAKRRVQFEGLGAVESVAKAPVGRRGIVHCPDYGLGSVAGNLDVDLVTVEAAMAPGEAAG